MVTRRSVLATSLATTAAAALAACSPAQEKKDAKKSGSGSDAKALTFRIWDEGAKPAYEESFKAFTEKTGIKVTLDVVPWDDYWTKLPLDLAEGASDSAPDVFWLNSASFTQFEQAGSLVNISKTLPGAETNWEDAVVKLYTRDGGLWGVPQIWDSIALFYNKKLVDAAKVDVTTLAFDPAASTDTLRDAAAALTADAAGKHPGEAGFGEPATFGFNAAADRQAIIGPFLSSNGAVWQDEKDKYAFASPQGVAAFTYLAALVNTQKVAPAGADTNANGDFARDLFIQGKLGLFQSGPYHLKSIADGVADTFEWGIAPMVKGPAGAKSLVHGVVAAGNAKKKDQDSVKKLLEWLGSAEGQKPLGAQGIAFPGHKDAQSAFVDYWKGQGVDVNQFIEAAKDPAPADTGAKSLAGLMTVIPIFQEIFAGNISAADGVKKAQEEGNAAMA